jgi:preprotein translocase subunit SecE
MKFIKNSVNFVKEVKVELGKVAWSTREELMASTVLVLAITGISAVFIGLLDIGLSKGLTLLFKM